MGKNNIEPGGYAWFDVGKEVRYLLGVIRGSLSGVINRLSGIVGGLSGGIAAMVEHALDLILGVVYRILDVAQEALGVACRLIGVTLGLQVRVASDLTGSLLDIAFGLIYCTLHLVVHVCTLLV